MYQGTIPISAATTSWLKVLVGEGGRTGDSSIVEQALSAPSTFGGGGPYYYSNLGGSGGGRSAVVGNFGGDVDVLTAGGGGSGGSEYGPQQGGPGGGLTGGAANQAGGTGGTQLAGGANEPSHNYDTFTSATQYMGAYSNYCGAPGGGMLIAPLFTLLCPESSPQPLC